MAIILLLLLLLLLFLLSVLLGHGTVSVSGVTMIIIHIDCSMMLRSDVARSRGPSGNGKDEGYTKA